MLDEDTVAAGDMPRIGPPAAQGGVVAEGLLPADFGHTNDQGARYAGLYR